MGELGSYQVGSEKFSYIGVSVSVVTEALKNAHFDVISVDSTARDDDWVTDSLDFVLVHAEKKLC